jgi:hypothetical protein
LAIHKRVVSQAGEGLVGQQLAGHRDGEHHQHQRGQQPSGAADPESGQLDPAGAPQLVE